MTELGLVNLDLLIPELLRALRGSRTQGQINQRLGYSFSQAYRWESGRKQITYEEFSKFCAACGKKEDLKRALFLGFNYKGNHEDAGKLLATLCEGVAPERVLDSLGCTRFQFSRWLNGKTKIPLGTIFRAGYWIRRGLFPFLEGLVNVNSLPSLEGVVRLRKLRLQLHRDHPETAAVNTALLSRQYRRLEKHDDVMVSQLLGIGHEKTEFLLGKMLELGLLEKANGKLAVRIEDAGLLGGRAHKARVVGHWLGRAQRKSDLAAESGEEGEARSLFSMQIVNLSRQRYEHLFRHANRFYAVLQKLLADPLPAGEVEEEVERVFAFHLHVVNLSEKEDSF